MAYGNSNQGARRMGATNPQYVGQQLNPQQMLRMQQQESGQNPLQSSYAQQAARMGLPQNQQMSGYQTFGAQGRQQSAPQYGAQAAAAAQQPQYGTQGYNPTQPPQWQQPQWNMGSQQSVPQYTPYQQPQQNTGANNSQNNPWGRYFEPGTYTPGTYNDKNAPWARMLENTLPVSQFLQNTNQWQQEFNQGNQRYWDQSNWQRQMDQYGMGLQGRQQTLQEQIAQQNAAQGWGALNQQQWRDTQEANLGYGRLGLDTELGRQKNANELLGIQNQNRYQMGQLDVQRQANTIDEMYKRGQLSNEQRQLALAELTQRQKYGLDTRAQSLAELTQQQRYGLDTRQQQLAELTQAQNEAYRRWEQGRQEQMQREQLAAQMQQASLQAFGRTQAPQMRFLRSWG